MEKPNPEEEKNRLKLKQDAWFEEWWAAYWLKKSRRRARDAFDKHVRTEDRFRRVMDATNAQAPEMLGREPQHRPHGTTWLNGERWEDETATEATPSRYESTIDPEIQRRLDQRRREGTHRDPYTLAR